MHTPLRGRTWRTLTLIALVFFASSCADKSLLPPTATSTVAEIRIVANFAAQLAPTTRTVDIKVGYDRTNGERVVLTQKRVDLTSDTQQVTVSVDLSACLSDRARAGTPDSCPLRIAVTIMDATGVALDTKDLGPFDVAPGGAPMEVSATLSVVASVAVTPSTATVPLNGTTQLTATAKDAQGNALTGHQVTWASNNTLVATVSSSGLVTGIATGAATITATTGALSGTASIIVTSGPLATITVTPNPATMAVTTAQQFIAVGRDASGNIVQFTPAWSVVANGGTIDQAGIFTAGGAPGTYANTVQASSLGVTGFATVNVTAGPLASITVTPNPATLIVGATQQFVATGKDASGNTVQIAATWSVVAGGGAVDGAGLFTAGAAPGTFTNTVRATSGALSATATVIVTTGPLASITVTPNPATIFPSGTQQFTAVGRDVGGNVVVITPTWAVVAGGGSINTTGLFTAGAVSGTFTNTVRASSGGLAGFATVIVP